MATKKRKCPDCGAKLMKGEKKGTKVCPDCLLFIDKDDAIIRQQGEPADEPDTGIEGNSSQDQETIKESKPVKKKTDPDGNKSVQKANQNKQPQEGGNIRKPRWDLDNVSRGLTALPEVTVYGWNIGIRGFRFGTSCPYPNPPWKKKMSGLEAFQFLSNIKRSNRNSRLEAPRLPEGEK